MIESPREDARRARAEETRGSLLSLISHDLRAPLATILGAATTLRDRSTCIDPEQRSALLESICEEAGRLERLVGRVLDMARLESETLAVKREWVPLEEIIGPPLDRLESRLADRAVSVALPEQPRGVWADPVLLQQALLNLLENAVKYTPAGSPIEIRASGGDGRVAIEVADRGPGLPEGNEARVFERGFRGCHPGVDGVGLGLSICQGIARAHGGSLAAANRSGGGAVFRMTLPFEGESPAVPLEEESRSAAAGGLG